MSKWSKLYKNNSKTRKPKMKRKQGAKSNLRKNDLPNKLRKLPKRSRKLTSRDCSLR